MESLITMFILGIGMLAAWPLIEPYSHPKMKRPTKRFRHLFD